MNIVQYLFVSLGLNGVFFIIAALLKTDVFTDITYSLSFVLLSVILLTTSSTLSVFQIVTAAAVMVWGLRLGAYLFNRILHMKVDHRFDDKRGNPVKFGMFWLLQAVTVWVVMLPIYGIFHASSSSELPVALLLPGAVIFVAGLTIEAVADAQKYRFKSKSENRGKFMGEGIWKVSRHPNYLGEMMVWWGLALPGVFLFRGIEYAYFAGPLFITLMLLFVSGIPLLEKSSDEKWGKDPEYLAYKDSTPLLIPFTKRKRK